MGLGVRALSSFHKSLAGIGLTSRQVLRIAVSLALGGALVWLLLDRLSAIEPAEVSLAFSSIAPLNWAAALAATAISFWAVGQYDAVIHSHFMTGQPAPRTRLAGICAIAVSQMIGLGVVVGAILRWRMLPETSLAQATKLTAAVALSFLAAWAMVTALVLLVLPQAPFKGPATATIMVGLGLTLLSLCAPRIGIWRFRWPNGFTLSRLLALCVIDTLAAASAFHALCPPEILLSFALLLPAFLLALGAGLISGTPGGIGAFEMTLLGLLPGQPEPDLLAAVLAWRLVYFAVPAILGAGLAIRGPRPMAALAPQPSAAHAFAARSAEMQLVRQGEHSLIGNSDQGLWLAAKTSHCLIALFSTLAQPQGPAAALKILSSAARAQDRLPVLYKASTRLAVAARRQGYLVLPLAREAIIHPAAYELGKSCRSGLRRKLRRAEASGVRILAPDLAPDWPALDQIASAWATSHGGERGFSMGRYDRRYVHGQRLFVAVLNDHPVAFVTFHDGPEEWVLDLMRHLPGLPDGTMHLLIQTAISDAASAGIDRLSLAAVPETAFADQPNRIRRLATAFASDNGAGLARFKSTFAPHWEPRYLCLPHRAALPLVLAELALAIHYPGPLPRPPAQRAYADEHEEYAFASAP